jgi:hypothetical protein
MWTLTGTCSLFKFSRNRYAPSGDTTGKGLTLLKSMRVLWRLPSKEPNFYFISPISNTAFSLDGGEGFDTTPAVFDANVVNEYLDGTGQLGGPLVTAPNVTDRSDYRIYISDSNATMQALSEEAVFQSTCYALFEGMINTVPNTITLSDPIVPMVWKGVNIMLDVSSAGVVSISGLIRNLYTITAPPSAVSYTTISSAGNSTQTSDTESGTGTSLYGNTAYFPFNSTIVPGTTSLAIEDVSYRIDDTIFVLPAQSTVTRATKVFQIKAAALTTLTGSMTAVLYVPTTQALTITKKIVNTNSCNDGVWDRRRFYIVYLG